MQSTPRKLTTDQKAVLIHVLLAFPDQQVGAGASIGQRNSCGSAPRRSMGNYSPT